MQKSCLLFQLEPPSCNRPDKPENFKLGKCGGSLTGRKFRKVGNFINRKRLKINGGINRFCFRRKAGRSRPLDAQIVLTRSMLRNRTGRTFLLAASLRKFIFCGGKNFRICIFIFRKNVFRACNCNGAAAQKLKRALRSRP